ncbi:MAG TPA: protein kinase [Bacteroidota bacterium]|jgi:serine/threonine protein kinase/Tol biopolymer transport system component
MIGKTISHYKIIDKLGEGGMGVVYKAEDTKLDRIVALKFLPHHLTANDAEKARFLQEAKAASSLNHPNVCTIYGIEEADGQQYIEMEYVDGVTLRQIIPIQKLSEVIAYAIQIADALQEAHSKGIVHRDIKADNIMLNAKKQIKVMDFGLAKLKGTLKLTRTSSTVGTLAYMAPEQIQGQDVDQRSDIFSFGVVLFEMLTGKLPFRGDHEAAIMYSIVNEEPESVQKYKPDLPPEFLHILGRALEKDPADRYQSAQEMQIDLRRLQKQSTKVSRTSMADMPVPTQESLRSPGLEAPPARKAFPRNSMLAIGAVLLLGVAIAIYRMFVSGTFTSREEPFKSHGITRLTTSGKASRAVISPDGRYVVHQVVEGELKSLWVRQVATTSNVMIVPPADLTYRGITFSNDGNLIYYVAIDDANPNGALFEIPVLGGRPRKILSDLATGVTFSPDGKRFAFVRQYHTAGEEALMIANLDGSGERKLAGRVGDDFFITQAGMAPSWSPDGKMIAIPAASNKGVQHVNLMGYSVEDGSEKMLSPENWMFVGRIAWFPDGRGLAALGTKVGSTNNQLWYVGYPGGTSRNVTNDLSDYDMASLGVTSDGKSLVTTNVELHSNIWVMTKSESGTEAWDVQRAVQITSGAATRDGFSGMTWTPDHKIVYSSLSSGTMGLFSMDMNGSNPHQLTLGPHREYSPAVSPDGKSIVYVSDKDTTAHLWRMDIDGGNPARLSHCEDYGPTVTPDGKFAVYSGWATGKTLLYKIPLAGGDSVNLSANPASSPDISPDGRLIVCNYYDERSRIWGTGILTLAGGVLQRFFTRSHSSDNFGWYPDGKSITYVETRNAVSNIWSVPASGGEPKQLTNFTTGLIYRYSWSNDGKYLALARGQQETTDVVLITESK